VRRIKDPAVAALPPDLRQLYILADALARLGLGTDGMLKLGARRYAAGIVPRGERRPITEWLGKLAAWGDDLDPLVAVAESRLVRARGRGTYSLTGHSCTCAHEAVLVLSRQLLDAVARACRDDNKPVIEIVEAHGPEEWQAHYRTLLTKHEVLDEAGEAGPRWATFCAKYRTLAPQWAADDIESALRVEVLLAASDAPPPGTLPGGQPIIPLNQNRNYTVGDAVVVVDDAEDTVLQAFAVAAGREPTWIPLSKKQLIRRTNQGRAPRILKAMADKYPALTHAIDCPGVKGRGGLKVYMATRPRRSRRKAPVT
jgi:hypothetical protein